MTISLLDSTHKSSDGDYRKSLLSEFACSEISNRTRNYIQRIQSMDILLENFGNKRVESVKITSNTIDRIGRVGTQTSKEKNFTPK